MEPILNSCTMISLIGDHLSPAKRTKLLKWKEKLNMWNIFKWCLISEKKTRDRDHQIPLCLLRVLVLVVTISWILWYSTYCQLLVKDEKDENVTWKSSYQLQTKHDCTIPEPSEEVLFQNSTEQFSCNVLQAAGPTNVCSCLWSLP